MRHKAKNDRECTKTCFSPVAGIQWVETCWGLSSESRSACLSFSPVAGIQWVETLDGGKPERNTANRVSVPLPGFSGLRPWQTARRLYVVGFSPVAGIQWVETAVTELARQYGVFQSRCRDSVG